VTYEPLRICDASPATRGRSPRGAHGVTHEHAPEPAQAPRSVQRAASRPPAGEALGRLLTVAVRERAARAATPGDVVGTLGRTPARQVSSAGPRMRSPHLQRTVDDALLYARSVLKLEGLNSEKALRDYLTNPTTPAEHRKVLQAQLDYDEPSGLGPLDTAAHIFRRLTGKDLLMLALASKPLRRAAQDYCQKFLSHYGDRYEFHLATRARLLYDQPAEKYGGKAMMGAPVATSAWKVYQSALKGTGPIVLGPIPLYKAMRDYTQLVGTEAHSKSIESNATYLMTFPWSLMVNAALVTGAIHGGRTMVGAADIDEPDVLHKDPALDPTNNFGLSVYGRELIQLVLVHGYCSVPPTEPPIKLPEPATGGGLVLHRPIPTQRPATLFDADELNERYQAAAEIPGLRQELENRAQAHSRFATLEFDVAITAQFKQLSSTQSKKYQKLRTRLKKQLDSSGLPIQSAPPAVLEMLKVVYPDLLDATKSPPIRLKSVPSIENWRIEQYTQILDDLHL
jgi:hypothetical protein